MHNSHLQGLNISNILNSASVDIQMQKTKTILTNTQASVKLPLTAEVDIPSTKFGSVVDQVPTFENGLK